MKEEYTDETKTNVDEITNINELMHFSTHRSETTFNINKPIKLAHHQGLKRPSQYRRIRTIRRNEQ